MFGMSDPAQTLLQIERYIQDGRMEMSEVMASEFTSMLFANKKRPVDSQVMLVKGLRLYCDILLLRNKAKEGTSIVKILHKERKKLTSILKKNAPELISKSTHLLKTIAEKVTYMLLLGEIDLHKKHIPNAKN